MKPSIRKRLKNIRVIAMDVDGVLTDGRVYWGCAYGLDGSGKPRGVVNFRRYNVKDGMGLMLLRKAGFKIVWISSAGDPSVERRARNLSVDRVYLRVDDKAVAWEDLKTHFRVDDREIAYVGDDVNDLPLLRKAGISIAPGDAVSIVREAADHCTKAVGGDGAIREIAELFLKASDRATEAVGSVD